MVFKVQIWQLYRSNSFFKSSVSIYFDCLSGISNVMIYLFINWGKSLIICNQHSIIIMLYKLTSAFQCTCITHLIQNIWKTVGNTDIEQSSHPYLHRQYKNTKQTVNSWSKNVLKYGLCTNVKNIKYGACISLHQHISLRKAFATKLSAKLHTDKLQQNITVQMQLWQWVSNALYYHS